MAQLGDGAGLEELLMGLALSPGLELTGGIAGWVEIVVAGDLGQSRRVASPVALMEVGPGCEVVGGAGLAGGVRRKGGGWKAASSEDLSGHWNNSRGPELNPASPDSVSVATELWLSSRRGRPPGSTPQQPGDQHSRRSPAECSPEHQLDPLRCTQLSRKGIEQPLGHRKPLAFAPLLHTTAALSQRGLRQQRVEPMQKTCRPMNRRAPHPG